MVIHRLCHINDIDNDTSKGFELEGQSLFAVKKFDRLYIYRNRCPHLGTPLEWLPDNFLDIDRELIQCSTHGALFVIESGDCVTGPCSGQRLQPIAFTIEGNEVFISLPPHP